MNRRELEQTRLLYEKYERVIEENERLRKKKLKNKIIQSITAWRYPCEKTKILTFDPLSSLLGIRLEDAPFKTKEDLIDATGGECSCGKGCKPEKVKIIVIKDKR